MTEYKYDVILYAPIGERSGQLLLRTEGRAVKGELKILRRSTELTGIICEDGSLEAEGELVTLMKRIPYSAEGRISGDDIQMTLYAGRRTYELTSINKTEKAGEQE